MDAASDGLSVRQREIVDCLRRGSSVKEISNELGISINTVKDYMKRLYIRANVHSARELLYHIEQPGPPSDTLATAEHDHERTALESYRALIDREREHPRSDHKDEHYVLIERTLDNCARTQALCWRLGLTLRETQMQRHERALSRHS
jgi:DNA-binding CsgD family transcriptional regulator